MGSNRGTGLAAIPLGGASSGEPSSPLWTVRERRWSDVNEDLRGAYVRAGFAS